MGHGVILGVQREWVGGSPRSTTVAGMDTLLAEDLLLLLLDDVKGLPSSMAPIQTVLGGALLAELALREHVTVAEKTSVWKSAKVLPSTSLSPPADPVLRAALEQVSEKERSASDLVARLGKGLMDRLAERLLERGILERRDEKVLGLFPRTRWPAADLTHELELRRMLTSVLVQGAEPDPRLGTLIALLWSSNRVHQAVDHEGMPAREVKKRAKEVAQGEWAAKAVKDAIDASTAAVIAVVAATSAAAGSG